MYKKRRLSWPPLPTSVKDVKTALQQANLHELEGNEPFLRSVVDTATDGSAIIFATQHQLGILSGAQHVLVDGTFKTVPALYYQLLTIMVRQGENCFPGCFVLMTNKNQKLYEEVFGAIKVVAPHFNPSSIMTDYEGALRNSLAAAFATSNLSGCWFHYTQAIYRKVQQLGLSEAISEESANFVIKKIMSLPLLPANKIMEGFEEIMMQADSTGVDFFPLFGYINRFWMRQIGEEQLSVNNSPERTNNTIESFHARLKRFIGIHPNIYVFVHKLVLLSLQAKTDCQRLARGLALSRKKKAKYALHDRQLQICKERLDADVYSVKDFLEAVKHYVGKHIVHPRETSEEVPVESSSTTTVEIDLQQPESETEENEELLEIEVLQDDINETCAVCLDKKVEGFALVPCGHQQFCRRCIDVFDIEDGQCPICRRTIQQVLRLY